MAQRPLRSGFTTGACAAAAARGAALLLRDQHPVDAVEIDLPAGFTARFELHGQALDAAAARCFVVKDAGDDPDVTHGVEVHAEVRVAPRVIGEPAVIIRGGTGIGRVTKPGLAVARRRMGDQPGAAADDRRGGGGGLSRPPASLVPGGDDQHPRRRTASDAHPQRPPRHPRWPVDPRHQRGGAADLPPGLDRHHRRRHRRRVGRRLRYRRTQHRQDQRGGGARAAG